MKNKNLKIFIWAIGALLAVQMQTLASTVKVLDSSFNVTSTPALGALEIIAARLGTWSGGVFTALPTSGGAFDNDLRELSVTVSNSTNAGAGLSAGTAFAVAIYKATSTTAYSSSFLQAVLTDSTWIMPALGFDTIVNTFTPTANAVAVIGSYSFSANNQMVTLGSLAAVPEPSVASLFALGTVGLVALRARRKS